MSDIDSNENISRDSVHETDNFRIGPNYTPIFNVCLEDENDPIIVFPLEFRERCTCEIPEITYFKTPNGPMMPVQLDVDFMQRFYVRRGWPEFKERYQIKYGDSISFQWIHPSHFNVHIFINSVFETKYAPDLLPSSREFSLSDLSSSFILTIETHHHYRLTIPSQFAKDTGIEHKSKLVLCNAGGVKMEARLQKGKGNDRRRIFLKEEWSSFYDQNDFKEGMELVFSYNPSSTTLSVYLR